MEHNTDLVMTCNCCESQDDFTWLRNSMDDDGCYRCDACGAIDDHRMAPEREELKLTAAEWAASQAERKPAARELHHDTQAILRQAARIRAIREELISELKEAK